MIRSSCRLTTPPETPGPEWIAPSVAVPSGRLNSSPVVAVSPQDTRGAPSFNRPYGTTGAGSSPV